MGWRKPSTWPRACQPSRRLGQVKPPQKGRYTGISGNHNFMGLLIDVHCPRVWVALTHSIPQPSSYSCDPLWGMQSYSPRFCTVMIPLTSCPGTMPSSMGGLRLCGGQVAESTQVIELQQFAESRERVTRGDPPVTPRGLLLHSQKRLWPLGI